MAASLPARRRRTKIVATLGPATPDAAAIRALLAAGVDVVRVNMSHGDHAGHRQAIAQVRAGAASLGRTVGILVDLQGPKIRVGSFAGPPRAVAAGDTIVFAVGRPPVGGELPADYPLLDRDVTPGQPLLIDDGSLACEVTAVAPGAVTVVARHAGAIAQRKGINLPETATSAPAISAKDEADARFAVAEGADMVAMSFVRRAADIEALRLVLAAAGRPLPIIAKIEKPQALDNLDAIVVASWGVMVARGDLGVELSCADVPMAQKRIIRLANRLARPVITATQMLDSMTRNPQPTRAEASDVANAVLDGSDAVMLSQETAAGRYPVEAVTMMGRIIDATERAHGRPHRPPRHVLGPGSEARRHGGVPEAVAHAGCEVVRDLDCRAIAVFTETGRMALLAAERRPDVPICAFCVDGSVRRALTLACNVTPLAMPATSDLAGRLRHLDEALRAAGMVADGDHVVVLVGAPDAPTGATNVMMVHRVGTPDGG